MKYITECSPTENIKLNKEGETCRLYEYNVFWIVFSSTARSTNILIQFEGPKNIYRPTIRNLSSLTWTQPRMLYQTPSIKTSQNKLTAVGNCVVRHTASAVGTLTDRETDLFVSFTVTVRLTIWYHKLQKRKQEHHLVIIPSFGSLYSTGDTGIAGFSLQVVSFEYHLSAFLNTDE